MIDNSMTIEKPQVFEDLIAFRKEVANPKGMKREIDTLLSRMGRLNAIHSNRVITKIMGRKALKHIVDMQIMLPLKKKTGINAILESYSNYFYINKYKINKSYHIRISNDQQQFRKAVEKFLKISNGEGLNKFSSNRQHIIEVARIDFYGNTLGFDLYMEIANNRGIDVNA